MTTAQEIIERLGLVPLGFEGGFYRETYRDSRVLEAGALADAYVGERRASTTIYYLLTPVSLSLMHRLRTAEVYHFYLGDPVEQLMLHPSGAGEQVVLGSDIGAGERVQHVVPAGVWQGSRLREGGRFALMGTTMAPGFELADFELGDRSALSLEYPEYAPLIDVLTPARLVSGALELAAASLDLLHAHLRGPETLATGLRTAVPMAWPKDWPEDAWVRDRLERLERDPGQREWGLWYVIDRRARTLIGAAWFDGPPDGVGKVRLETRVPSPRRAATEDALRAHIAKSGRAREVIVSWDDGAVR